MKYFSFQHDYSIIPFKKNPGLVELKNRKFGKYILMYSVNIFISYRSGHLQI